MYATDMLVFRAIVLGYDLWCEERHEGAIPDEGDETLYGLQTFILTEEECAQAREEGLTYGQWARENIPAPSAGAFRRLGWIPAPEPIPEDNSLSLAFFESLKDRHSTWAEACLKIIRPENGWTLI